MTTHADWREEAVDGGDDLSGDRMAFAAWVDETPDPAAAQEVPMEGMDELGESFGKDLVDGLVHETDEFNDALAAEGLEAWSDEEDEAVDEAMQRTLTPQTTAKPRIGYFLRRTVYGWGQYRRQVSSLPPPQRATLAEIGNLIVGSFGPGRRPIHFVHAYGHADRDTPRNPARERQMSAERARRVVSWLQAYVGPTVRSRVSWQAVAVGASQLRVAPMTEANRRMNRRVEICLGGAPGRDRTGGTTFGLTTSRKARFYELVAPHIHQQTGTKCWAYALASWRSAQQAWDEAKVMRIPQFGAGIWTDPTQVLAQYRLYTDRSGALYPLSWPNVAGEERMDYAYLAGRAIMPARVRARLVQDGYLYWAFQRSVADSFSHVVVVFGVQYDPRDGDGVLMLMDPQTGKWDYPRFADISRYQKNMIAWRGTGQQQPGF